MKKSELKFSSEFVGRCVFDGTKPGTWNYDEKYASRVKSYLRKAELKDDFIDAYLGDKVNREKQGYWVLIDYERPWMAGNLLKEMLGGVAMLTTTMSDAGSVKVGDDSFSILIPNGRGDGVTIVAISEERTPMTHIMKFLTSISGTFNIYKHDCENEVRRTITGRYGIYNRDGVVLFEKWEER